MSDIQTQADNRTVITSESGVEIKFDAVFTRGHSFSSSVTSAPVEDGSVITDHVTLEPESISIDGMVSDHPVPVKGDPLTVQSTTPSLQRRSRKAADELFTLWQTRQLVKLVTKLHTYDSMVIESLRWDETAEGGEALNFSMTLRQIRKAKLTTVQIDKLASAQSDLAAEKQKRGTQRPRTDKARKLAKQFETMAKQTGKAVQGAFAWWTVE